MNNQAQIEQESKKKPEPHVKYKFEKHVGSGRKEFQALELSDKTHPDSEEFAEKLCKALECTSGSSDPEIAQRIISKIAWGMSSSDNEERIGNVTALLHALAPQDEAEAIIAGSISCSSRFRLGLP